MSIWEVGALLLIGVLADLARRFGYADFDLVSFVAGFLVGMLVVSTGKKRE